MNKILSTIIGLVVVSVLLPASSASAHSTELSREGWCLSLPVKVAPSQGQPRTWTVAATYCRPWRGAQETDVLTHGATYTGAYWDWPQESYSYVVKTLHARRATLSYDRIGNGDSTRPLSTEITMATDAYVLHQLIKVLYLLGARHINSIGHSYGSGVALAEAATDYHDGIKVNTLVLTGYLHRPSNPAVTAGNYPANLDPKFASDGLDSGWLTTRPGARAYGFHAPTSDPAVVAFDEDHKDLVSLTGLLGFLGQRNTPAATNISQEVKMPVLEIVGSLDAIFCYQPELWNCSDSNTVESNEAPYFHNVSTHVVSGSGHDLTLAPVDAFTTINNWLLANA